MVFKDFYYMHLITEKDSNLTDDLKELLKKGQSIATKLGLKFNGWQEAFEKFAGAYVFSDPKTKSSFFATTEEEAKQNLSKMRLKYGL
jgi:hypothetical protein